MCISWTHVPKYSLKKKIHSFLRNMLVFPFTRQNLWTTCLSSTKKYFSGLQSDLFKAENRLRNKTAQFYFKPKKHIMHNYVNKHSMVGWHELQMNLHYSPRSNPHVLLWKYHVKWIKLQLKTVVSKFLDYNFLSEKRLIFFKFWSR